MIRNVIETEGAAEDVRIAEEIAPPEEVAENDDVGRRLRRRARRRE